MAVKFVLFDLDGTLVHSAPDIARAANRALQDVGRAPRAVEEICGYVGNGAETLIHRCLTGERHGLAPLDMHRETYSYFQTHYAACLLDTTQPYLGVVDTLEALHANDVPLGCITNKPLRFAEPLLEGLNLARFFKLTYGGDSFPTKKPDPTPLYRAAQCFGIPPHHGAMVGDSLTDLKAGRAAGMRVLCVSYGYSAQVNLALHQPDALVADMRELLPFLLA